MSIDRLLALIRYTRSILVSEYEIWLSSTVTQDLQKELQRGLRKHRRGVRLLLAWSSIDACPAAGLHRKYWRYDGHGRYVCEVCEKIAV